MHFHLYPARAGGGSKRGLNKYSTTLADRARDFSCLREGNRRGNKEKEGQRGGVEGR